MIFMVYHRMKSRVGSSFKVFVSSLYVIGPFRGGYLTVKDTVVNGAEGNVSEVLLTLQMTVVNVRKVMHLCVAIAVFHT